MRGVMSILFPSCYVPDLLLYDMVPCIQNIPSFGQSNFDTYICMLKQENDYWEMDTCISHSGLCDYICYLKGLS